MCVCLLLGTISINSLTVHIFYIGETQNVPERNDPINNNATKDLFNGNEYFKI